LSIEDLSPCLEVKILQGRSGTQHSLTPSEGHACSRKSGMTSCSDTPLQIQAFAFIAPHTCATILKKHF
jgi:hypothetical protein